MRIEEPGYIEVLRGRREEDHRILVGLQLLRKHLPETLVDEWDAMLADACKRMLAAIFDSVTATADGVDRLEPYED